MGNLSKFSKEESATVTAIYDFWKKRGDSEAKRGYLGASIIGHECDRFLWYGFRWVVREKFDGRLYRLFNTGHREEARFLEELRGIGCECHGDGDEQIGVEGVHGHFKGHMDGVALGIPEAPKTWHLLEFKTHNSKSFEKVKADGVEKAKPMHYAQMQGYMGLGKLTRGLYLAVNKDNDELYSERIEYVPTKFKAIMARAERIIFANDADKCATRPDDFRCKTCPGNDACWGEAMLPKINISCRSCCHATPEKDGEGRWSCSVSGDALTIDEQLSGCKYHLVLPSLVDAKAVDSTDKSVTYELYDGTKLVCGDGGWSTNELTGMPAKLVSDANKVKIGLGGLVTGFEVPELNLLEKYDPKESRLVWEGMVGDQTALVLENKTGEYHDSKHNAFEYGGKYLYVEYIGSNYAAIWEVVE